MDLLNSLGSDGAQPGPQTPECSRKGCRSEASWQVLWNNPKIHTPERRKIWLACDEHRVWLQDYLTQRMFWRSTERLESPEAQDAGAEAGS